MVRRGERGRGKEGVRGWSKGLVKGDGQVRSQGKRRKGCVRREREREGELERAGV